MVCTVYLVALTIISSLLSLTSGFKYKVCTYTGDVRGAGAVAYVTITIFGENGDTEEGQCHDLAINNCRTTPYFLHCCRLSFYYDVNITSLFTLCRSRLP